MPGETYLQPSNYQPQRTEYFVFENWSSEDAPALYSLERKAWAPWLRKPEKNFEIIRKIFPEGQLKLSNIEGKIIAFASTNKINWDGRPESLITWDFVAGGSIKQSDFSRTYTPNGNTLCFMSLTFDPIMEGRGLAVDLVSEVIRNAKKLEAEHVIASLRPSSFGIFRSQPGNEDFEFEDYCKFVDNNNLPIDPLFRIAAKHHMKPLRIEDRAIRVKVSKYKFNEFRRTFNTDRWLQNKDGSWECGEAGKWIINGNNAEYCEANLWCEIPIN